MNRKLAMIPVLALLVAGSATAQTVIEAERIYTMAGDPIQDGVIVLEDGRIAEVGPADQVGIPEEADTYQAEVATPGLIDARTSVGLAGMYNVEHDRDELDTTDPIQASLRALDAYNAREGLVKWLRDLGVTTVHTGPAPGALVSGQSLIARTTGDTVDQAHIKDPHGVIFSLGPGVSQHFESPGTRPKGAEMLRQALSDAQAHAENRGDGGRVDLGQEVLADVVEGKTPAIFHANTAVDIMTALRLGEEFGLDLVLAGAADAHKLIDEIAEADVPVLLHPTMIRPAGETANAAFDTAMKLEEAGIPFAITGGYEGYVPRARVVLFEAGVAAANGLGREAALASVTREPARILGLDDRLGSIESGKEANLVLYTGDPFEYVTQVCEVFIEGRLVSEDCQ